VQRNPAAKGGSALSLDGDQLQSEEMMAVANDLLRGYLALTERGYHPRTVAMAMMGATVNLFDVLDLNAELPPLLRAIAERVDEGKTGS
jgi:hypothetical protein